MRLKQAQYRIEREYKTLWRWRRALQVATYRGNLIQWWFCNTRQRYILATYGTNKRTGA